MESPLLDKSLEFASQVVLFYEDYSKSKRSKRQEETDGRGEETFAPRKIPIHTAM